MTDAFCHRGAVALTGCDAARSAVPLRSQCRVLTHGGMPRAHARTSALDAAATRQIDTGGAIPAAVGLRATGGVPRASEGRSA